MKTHHLIIAPILCLLALSTLQPFSPSTLSQPASDAQSLAAAANLQNTKPLPANETASVPAVASTVRNVHHRYLFAIPAPAPAGAPTPASTLPPIENRAAGRSDTLPSKIENPITPTLTITLTGIVHPSTVTLLVTGQPIDYIYDGSSRTLTINLPATKRANHIDIVNVELPAIAPPTPAADLATSPADLWQPADKPNTPMGIARGIHPGRVTWMRNLRATPWDGVTGNWWQDDTGINQAAVDAMFTNSIIALVNGKTPPDTARNTAMKGAHPSQLAWDALFRSFNKTQDRGDHGYRPGEKIAIKVNINNAYSGHTDADNQIDASPQTIHALLHQLVTHARVPESDITVYEATRFVPDRIYKKCHAAFPGVHFVDSTGGNGREKVAYTKKTMRYSVADPKVGQDLPTCLLDATYLINMSLIKGHPSTGITLTAKNHYGTVNIRDHRIFVNAHAHDKPLYHPFVDMIGSKEIGGKTLLYILDGLYALRDVNDDVSQTARWHKLFHGEYLASIFMSQDPVAIDSVGLDFWRSEFPAGRQLPQAIAKGDHYMHEAALADNPPSGTKYAPDGKPLESLGVHEHWNNPADKQYSRNLDPQNGKGIELHIVPAE